MRITGKPIVRYHRNGSGFGRSFVSVNFMVRGGGDTHSMLATLEVDADARRVVGESCRVVQLTDDLTRWDGPEFVELLEPYIVAALATNGTAYARA